MISKICKEVWVLKLRLKAIFDGGAFSWSRGELLTIGGLSTAALFHYQGDFFDFLGDFLMIKVTLIKISVAFWWSTFWSRRTLFVFRPRLFYFWRDFSPSFIFFSIKAPLYLRPRSKISQSFLPKSTPLLIKNQQKISTPSKITINKRSRYTSTPHSPHPFKTL